MDNDGTFSDKATFAVSFVVLLLTLSTCGNNYLNNIVLDFFSHSFSALQLLFIMATILFISTYCSAFVQLKYSTLKLTSWRVLTAFNLLADMTYALAILFPFLIFIMYFISSLFLYMSSFENTNTSLFNTLTTIFNLTAIIAALFQSYNVSKMKRKDSLSKSLQDTNKLESNLLRSAKDSFEADLYEYMLIELNKSIQLKLYSTLLEKYSLTKSSATFSELASIALKNKLIDSNQYDFIKNINSLRNKAVHGKLEPPLDKNEAKQLLDNTITFISYLSEQESFSEN